MVYGVDLKKIMGINVAFDIVDNTDDIEPGMVQNKEDMLSSGKEATPYKTPSRLQQPSPAAV